MKLHHVALIAMNVAALSPASGARVLYSYVSPLFEDSVTIISDSFIVPGVSEVPALTCMENAVTCSTAEIDHYIAAHSDLFSVFPSTADGAFTFPGAAYDKPGIYSDGLAVMAVQVLSDTDVVYSYVDPIFNDSVTIVSDGYIGLGLATVPALTCMSWGEICSTADMDHFVTASSDYFSFFPAVSNGIVFPGSDYDQPGIYAAGPAKLAVVGPVAREAVPEPVSWSLMLGGFGLVGGMMRRRRAIISFSQMPSPLV